MNDFDMWCIWGPVCVLASIVMLATGLYRLLNEGTRSTYAEATSEDDDYFSDCDDYEPEEDESDYPEAP